IEDSAVVTCKVFDITGVLLGTFESTKSDVSEAARRELNLRQGIYVITLETGKQSETMKIQF
ncbi:MAG: T9SS type A sorting domain-containing protein, partial [Muribaculaceae bacterium]|nr:T9SS type A sorting domain-containing protein [Muribaculaceae bacterium]